MNRSFSITRTAKVVSWLFENNKRQLGVLAGVMLGVMGFETVVNMLGDYYQFAYHHVVIQAGNMALTMIFLLLLLSPAFIMRKLSKTGRAVEFFALPASHSEKYVASWLFVVIGGALAFLGGFLLYDVVQFLLASVLLPGHAEWAVSYLTYSFSFYNVADNGVACWDALCGLGLFVWIQSVYALGGTFFRRFQWLFVTLFLFAMLILMAMIVTERIEAQTMELILNAKQYLMFLCGVFAIFTVLNYWLSFRFFKRSQVINNRWVNF